MRLNTSNIAIIKRLLTGKSSRPLKSILRKCEPADIATLFSFYPLRENMHLIQALLSTGQAAEVLEEVPEPQLKSLLEALDEDATRKLFSDYAEDDCAFFLSLLNEDKQETILDLLSPRRAQRLKQILSYPEDTAGRIMNTEVFSIPANLNAEEGIEYLRQKPKDAPFYYAYLTDDEARLVGVVSLREMATAAANTPLMDLAKKDIVATSLESTTEEVSILVERYNFLAIPVVNEDKKVMGIVEIDDVIDIIQEQATADIYASAGLQEDDRVYSPILFSIKHRFPWMLLNLGLAAWVSRVVSLFEGTMQELIILATLNNIVAGMGGNTAIQTLTVVTRGIALEDFSYISRWRVILKEVMVGSFNGFVIGIVAAVLVYYWKDNLMVSIVIWIALVINSMVASLLGASIPMLLKRLGKDPAAGSGVLVTTLTDAAGFFAFLGIASLGMVYFKDYL
mgnify:CR=1 FL=1|tara:strand:- start:706 stop:2064 length:1359 start_codon:yes stop_codon:yes gene_type:complete